MNRPTIRILLGVLACCGLSALVHHAQARDVMNLDGVWNFATDPKDQGEAEQWHQPGAKLPAMPLPGYAPTANGKIQVPGIWDNQGYGEETEKVRHNFVGKGWYKRQIDIPQAWAGQRVFLCIGGVSRSAKAWVNGKLVGEHVGYVAAFEWDVTDHVAPGSPAVITIQVDSKQHWEVDAMYSASALADYMDVPWGGIWGHVSLEARPTTWLSDLYLQSDLSDSSCTASATLNGQGEAFDAAKLEILDKNGQCVATATVKPEEKIAAGQPISVKAVIPNASLWTPDTPTFYTAKLSLQKGGKTADSLESRFGMRQFSADGYHLLLNGKRIMLHGYGDDHIYPEQMAMPSDKDLHLKQLRLIKSYGFNHVRHHSTMMCPEYYDACDEVGIIPTAEFAICYSAYLPGIGQTWKAKVKPGTDPGPALETYKQEWAGAIKRHRNHPSILCWVRGNELYEEMIMCDEFAKIAKELDPTRWYVDSDGYYIQRHDKDRSTLPVQFVQFAEWEDPVANLDKYKTDKPSKPMISHETSNYTTFSRPDLADQFRHNMKPFWLTAGKAKLEKLGLSQETNAWADKSERLYALLQKSNFESLRRNPYLSGHHWWLFQDYWTSSNGLVDHYFRPKSIKPEEVLKYVNDVVLLQQGVERTYRAKNRLNAAILISNFSPAALQGKLVWEVKLGDKSLARKELTPSEVPQGEVAEAAKIDVELPETASPSAIKITAELTTDGKRFVNDWSTWLFPAEIRPATSAVPVFVTESRIEEFQGWDVKPIPAEGSLSERAVYVTDDLLDHRVVDAMERGASVVLFGMGDQFLPPIPITFRTTWWKAGDAPDRNHCGTFVYDHPVTRAMAPEGWCDAGWLDLIEGATKYVLETAPARPNVLIRALPSMALVEDDALLFEVGVGKGSLIVSGLNHQRAKGRPENQWILSQLIGYAATMPKPKATWPASMLSVAYSAPEGCLPGFRRLVANKGETSTWYSYRQDKAKSFVCRQNDAKHRIAWETVAVPADLAADRVTFAFAGALGYSSQPKTDGFVLEINGKDAVKFDMPVADRWQSDDKRVELRFEKRRAVTEDTFGLFFVTVPRDMLTPGKPCQLAVRSLGQGSQRWFGLNPYSDLK
jgi:hypothetical protein